MQPLSGIKVLDFSTLLPGPMATLILAEAGADVIKLERPGTGDDARGYEPRFADTSVNYGVLNRGKRSITVDLKDADDKARLMPLIRECDVLVEQFRPGVMARLGLDYESLREINPKLVYCSISGYGQDGPLRDEAGHDLNYQARTGMLNIAAGSDGAPVIPPVLIADLAGGTYPAVLNILLALRQRDNTGEGSYVDIAMTDNLFPLMYWALGAGEHTGRWPRPGGERVTGGSPRYHIYSTRDGQYMAAAPLEEKFWQNFCDVIDLPEDLRADEGRWDEVAGEVATRVAAQDASHWRAVFDGVDACTCIVENLETAFNTEQFRARGLFDYQVSSAGGESITALPVPVIHAFRGEKGAQPFPGLGEHNDILEDGESD